MRLTGNTEFKRVFEARLSVADGRLIVYALATGADRSRLGVCVGKKLGSAVERNRYKRTLREAFRKRQHELPAGFDYVLLPRPTASPSTRYYEESLVSLCRRLKRRSDKRSSKNQ